VAGSIVGRLRAIGGTASVTSTPDDGTEVELRVARPDNRVMRVPR
jgi:signal transduction histidine kinase